MKKRILSMLLAALLLVSILAGCAAKTDAQESANNNAVDTQQPDDTSEPAADDGADAPAVNYTLDLDALRLDSAPEEYEQYLGDVDLDGAGQTIALCFYSLEGDDLVFMKDVSVEACEELGVNYLIFDGQSDVQKLNDQIKNAISQGVDAIVLQPADASSSIAVLREAREAGIKVVTSQCELDASGADAYDCYVGPDEDLAGEIAANLMLKYAPEGGNVVIIEGLMGSTQQILRDSGFEKVLEKNPQFTLLDKQSADWSIEKSINVMESYISKYGEDIDIVYCHADLFTLAARDVCESYGLTDVIYVSIDGQSDALKLIAEGTNFVGTAMQTMEYNCKTCVAAAVALVNGAELEQDIYPSYIVIEQENADKFEIDW